MTAIEHMEEIRDYCIEQKVCCNCKYRREDHCMWNSIFYSHPYTWDFEPLEEVLKER